MTPEQHLALAEHHGELAADESVADQVLHAAAAAHHGRLAQQCAECGGTGVVNPEPGAWLACRACNRRGWIRRGAQ